MKTLLTHRNNQDGIFVYLLMLTSFFILLEISFFIQCNSAYLSDFTFISNHLHVPMTVLPGILFFLFVQLLLHFAYCVVVWMVSVSVADFFPIPSEKRLPLALSIWLLGIATMLTANQVYFPNSKFAELTALVLFNAKLTLGAFYLLCAICITSVLITIADMARNTSKIILIIFSMVTTAFILLPKNDINDAYDAATKERPNVIIIGVDSLRPDFLSFFGGNQATPFMDSFLENAVVFSDAITPLARTFPSWTSILTGAYPTQVNVRFNLAQQEKMKLTETLPYILRKHGYETLFATDETRFSNIDTNFGFDQVITPPMGLNDFLIGTFNDFPFSNLLVNTTLGKWLFPYSYANRPVFITYNPNTFLNLLQDSIPTKRNKPLFLAVHFCLPHTPYAWSSLQSNRYTAQQRYEQSIVRVDKQIRDFFAMLKERRLLDHAILVLLSDHGEALEFSGDRITEKELYVNKDRPVPQFYPPSLENEGFDQSAGHGTDVLGLSQYHTLLAFSLRGTSMPKNGIQSRMVSLVDIKPTILDLLDMLASAPPLLGTESQASLIKGQGRSVSMLRHFFLESDYSPESIRTVYPETEKVLLDGIQLFQVNPFSMRLTVRDEMGEMIINSKQHAVIYDDWMLAIYPQNKSARMPILINLVTGKWTNDLHSPFAQHSPASYMLEALKSFYGKEGSPE